jgi:hypothetical protein
MAVFGNAVAFGESVAVAGDACAARVVDVADAVDVGTSAAGCSAMLSIAGPQAANPNPPAATAALIKN